MRSALEPRTTTNCCGASSATWRTATTRSWNSSSRTATSMRWPPAQPATPPSPTARRGAATSASCSGCRASWSSCRTGWQHTRHKVVILFEGRDAAGKGGVIKRITQRLNPRVCRVVGAAGAERPRAHAVVLPALRRAPAGGRRDGAVRPQLVQPRRRRARDGLLQRRRSTRSSSARCPSSSACWCARASSSSSTGSRSPTKSSTCASSAASTTR